MAGQTPPPPPGFVLQNDSSGVRPRVVAGAPTPRPAMPNIQFADDNDALIRTVIGEAQSEPAVGRQAVAAVVRNRARNKGLTPAQVVLEQNQFEPWGNPATARRLMSIRPTDAIYQEVAQQIAGDFDPTNGADHFYAPAAQEALGRNAPSWATGDPLVIGRHNFYRLDGSSAPQAADPIPADAANVPPPPEGFVIAPAGQVGEQIVDSGYDVRNGRVILDGQDMGTEAEYAAAQRRSQQDREARATRMADPKFQLASQEAASGSANVPDQLRALLNGQSLGFGTEINARIQGALQGLENLAPGEDRYSMADATQAARDSERDAAAKYAADHPVANFGLQLAGGLLTPGVGAAGDYIAGASGSARLARAGQVGAGYGAAAGFGNAEGNVAERLPETVVGALTGAGTGAIGQGVVDRLARPVGQAATSAARRLSRRGIDLTPGQMASDIPGIGSTAKYAEDIVGGFNPLMGGVRRRQNEQVIRAAGQEALDAVGARLPREARTGYQVSQNVMKVLGDEYDKVLPRVSAQADPQFMTDLQTLVTDAGQTLDDGHFNRLNRILDQNILERFSAGGDLSGEQFKRIETTLRQQSERANRPTSTLEDVDLAETLDNTREIIRNLIARQHPEEAARIQDINRGYAVAARVRRAVTGSAGFARQGTPTPGEITQTVANMSSESQIMNETGLLQGLASDAREVLPASMGDTGSGQRAVLGGLGVAGTAGVGAISPALAAGIASGAIVYSRPGIAALNLLYRATDSQAASDIVRNLARLAQRDPALQPYYQAAVEHALSLGRTQTPTNQPAQSSAPVPTPVQ